MSKGYFVDIKTASKEKMYTSLLNKWLGKIFHNYFFNKSF